MGGSYYPQPYQGDRLLELMQQRGQIGAQAAQQSGEIWGGALQSLGQQAGRFAQQYGEQQKVQAQEQKVKTAAATMAKRDAAWVSYVNGGEWAKDPEQSYKTAINIFGPDGEKQFKALEGARTLMHPKRDPEKDQKAAGLILGGMENMSDQARAVLYPQAHKLVSGAFPDVPFPDQYDPKVWAEQIAPLGPVLRGEKASAGHVVQTVGPDGQPVQRLVNDAEMAKGVPMVPPKPPAGHMVTVAGPNGQPIQRLASEEELKAGVAAYREPKAPKAGDADHERLIQAVVANPSLWNDLTPTEKGKLAPDLNAQGFTGFGKPMTDGAIKQISETKSAIDSLQDLRSTLKENEQYIGPIAGFQAINPYSDANKAQAKIDLVRQRVGKALEGGVLRKEDEEKYKKILATLRDTPENAISKVDNLIKTLERDTATFADQQRLAGRRTPQQGGAAPPQAPAAGPPRAGSVVRGYRFLGGNPADPKAWVRQ